MSKWQIAELDRVWPKAAYTAAGRDVMAPETLQQASIRHIRQAYATRCLEHLRCIKSPMEPRYDAAMKWFLPWLSALDRAYEQARG